MSTRPQLAPLSVVAGIQAASASQGTGAIAIGYQAGYSGQKPFAVAIGYQAGFSNQGTGAIAIGPYAGYSGQAARSIAISAPGTTGLQLNPGSSGLYIYPVNALDSGDSIAAITHNHVTKHTEYASAVFINPSGSLGVGTTGPGYTLTVNGGSLAVTDTITNPAYRVTNSQFAWYSLNNTLAASTGGSLYNLAASGSSAGSITYATGVSGAYGQAASFTNPNNAIASMYLQNPDIAAWAATKMNTAQGLTVSCWLYVNAAPIANYYPTFFGIGSGTARPYVMAYWEANVNHLTFQFVDADGNNEYITSGQSQKIYENFQTSTLSGISFSSPTFTMSEPGSISTWRFKTAAWSAGVATYIYKNGAYVAQGSWIYPATGNPVRWNQVTVSPAVTVVPGDTIYVTHTSLASGRNYTCAVDANNNAVTKILLTLSNSFAFTPSINTWIFIAMTMTSTNTAAYINGQLVGSRTIGGIFTSGTNTFNVGGLLHNGYNSGVNGRVDDVRLFDYALTPSQVYSLYAAATDSPAATVPNAGLIANPTGSLTFNNYPASTVRAYISFVGNSAVASVLGVNGSFNVAGVSRAAVGRYTILFTNPLPTPNYSWYVSLGYGTTLATDASTANLYGSTLTGQTTTSLTILCCDASGATATDFPTVTVTVVA